MALREEQVVILYFTVPITCSRPSIEMIAFITVPTTCSRPSIEMVGFITVPTTCSRPSIEMVCFMYVFIYVFLRRQCPDHTFPYLWLKFRM